MRRRSPHPTHSRTAAVLLLTAALAGVLVAPQPAHAASRATLWSLIGATADDYNDVKGTWATFPTADRVRWSRATSTAGRGLAVLRSRLRAADTQSRVNALAEPVEVARKRARVFRSATMLSAGSLSARRSAVRAGQSAFSSYQAGSMEQDAWLEIKSDSAAVAALAAQDRRRAWAALGTTSYPTAATAIPALPTLASSRRAMAPSGWVGVPGGCALPSAGPEWLGVAAEPGPHLWVTSAHVTSALARGLVGDERGRESHDFLQHIADKLKTPLTKDLTAVATPLQQRSQRLGYASLLGDLEASRWLRADLTAVVPPGPRTQNSLRDAISLEALATDLDWLGLDEEDSSAAALLREAVLVRWLGPLSCRYDDLEATVVDADNISIIVGTGALHGALALSHSEPVVAAALARTALERLQPGMRAVATDGGSFEGPSYWNLQGRYLAAIYGTVHSTYGDTPPLRLPSPNRQAAYAWGSTTKAGRSLPFADSLPDPDPLRPGVVAWVAHRSADPRAGALARSWLRSPTEGFQVLWWPTEAALSAAAPQRLSALYPRTGVAVLQAGSTTAWLKGGAAGDPHAHIDRGLVGFNKYGIHWAVDPGQDSYALAQYNSSGPTSRRWTYWKVSSKGHSTISPPMGQPPLRSAVFSAFAATSSSAMARAGTATVNLRNALPGSSTATRTAALSEAGTLQIGDRVTSAVARPWTWTWVTDANVAISGSGSTRTITLTRSGRTVRLSLWGIPRGSKASVVPAPNGAVGPDGRALRVVVISLAPTRNLALNARVH